MNEINMMNTLLQRKQYVDAVRFYEQNIRALPEHSFAHITLQFDTIIEQAFHELLLDEELYLKEYGFPSTLLAQYDSIRHSVAETLFTPLLTHHLYYVHDKTYPGYIIDAQPVSEQRLEYLLSYGLDSIYPLNEKGKEYTSFEEFTHSYVAKKLNELKLDHLQYAVNQEQYEMASQLRDNIRGIQ
jgi:hypothetical protein